jgi:uracil phosphoribosyltransferase
MHLKPTLLVVSESNVAVSSLLDCVVADDLVLIADPMLATGGTMMQVRPAAGCT